jgi:hypothetical protein
MTPQPQPPHAHPPQQQPPIMDGGDDASGGGAVNSSGHGSLSLLLPTPSLSHLHAGPLHRALSLGETGAKRTARKYHSSHNLAATLERALQGSTPTLSLQHSGSNSAFTYASRSPALGGTAHGTANATARNSITTNATSGGFSPVNRAHNRLQTQTSAGATATQ